MNITEEAKNTLRDIPVEILDIPARAKNALIAGKVDNVLNAIDVIKTGFEGVSGVGVKTISESVKIIDDLLVKIEDIEPGLILNVLAPREAYFAHADGNVLEVFSPILDLYFEKKGEKYAKRDKEILCKRFNIGGGGEYTLEDIGTYYNLTRERVRQVAARTISDLDLLLSGRLKTKNWQLDSRLTDRYLTLKDKLSKSGFILSTTELDSFLNEEFSCSLEAGEFHVFMKVLGYTKLPTHIDGFRGKIKSCWYLPDQSDRKEIESIFQAIDLVFNFVSPIKKFDLIVKVKRKIKKKITNESIYTALKLCEEIEVDGELISIKFNYLRNAADKAYRFLCAKNKPIHYSQLCKEMNRLDQSLAKSSKPIKQTNLKNQMVEDERFEPIGKSGKWRLARWSDFENITIINAIESVLDRSSTPLSFAEIVKRAKEMRPDASEKSLRVYLTNKPTRFTQVGEDLYAPASWKMTPFERRKIGRVTNEVFYDVVKAILKQQNPMPFPKFIEKMSNKTSLREHSIRARVNASPVLNTRDTHKRYKEIYCDDLSFDLQKLGLVKNLLRDRVQGEIRSILYGHPNTPMKKGDLYKLVNKAIPCQKPTFYQYLDKTTDIRQYKEDNFYYAVYEHSEEGSNRDINQI